jgi:hypothetical protein
MRRVGSLLVSAVFLMTGCGATLIPPGSTSSAPGAASGGGGLLGASEPPYTNWISVLAIEAAPQDAASFIQWTSTGEDIAGAYVWVAKGDSQEHYENFTGTVVGRTVLFTFDPGALFASGRGLIDDQGRLGVTWTYAIGGTDFTAYERGTFQQWSQIRLAIETASGS